MGVTIPGQSASYAVGNNVGSFLHKAADAVSDFVCGLYKDYPGAIVDQRFPITRDLGTGIMDGLCAKRSPGLPIPLNPGFPGGQCVTTYVVRTQRTAPSPTGGAATISFNNAQITGKIQGLIVAGTNTQDNTTDWKIAYIDANGLPQLQSAGVYPSSNSLTIVSVTRLDGQADNCGDRPPGFPPSTIPPARSNTTINLPLSGGGKLTIPIAYIPIKPELNVAFQPKFGFNLGGIPITLDAGGITFELPDSPDNRLPGGSDTGSGSPSSGSPGTGIGDSLDDLSRKIDDLRDDPVPCIEKPNPNTPGNPDFPPDEGQPAEGGDEDRPGIKYLEVVLTKLPDKEHFGNGGENVVFAGWIAFRAKSGGYYPRQQINFRQSVFEAPEGADGYTFTFTNGAEGRVREYVEPVIEE